MRDLQEIINQKFSLGFEYYLDGKDSLLTDKGCLGLASEVVALDSFSGPDSRCILTRDCLDSPGVSMNDIDIISWGVEIPRTEGDNRPFEDLPKEAIFGNLFAIGINMGEIEILNFSEDLHPGWLSVEGLAFALSGMRVVERNPLR